MEEVLAPGALIVIIIAGNGVRQCIIISYGQKIIFFRAGRGGKAKNRGGADPLPSAIARRI